MRSSILLFVVALFRGVLGEKICVSPKSLIRPVNGCVNFTVAQGTGCQWMCDYCASQLGTNNYYFTTGVCTYETGGFVGNPQAGVTYTCCPV
jgi:hypothetical protein